MTAPVFIWNAQHRVASFQFQGARGARRRVQANPGPRDGPGEIAYLLPWIFAPLIAGLAAAWGRRSDERRLFLLCLALPPIVLFTITPLWGARGLPQWTMPGWFFAFPLMGAWLDERAIDIRALRRWAFISSGAWRPSQLWWSCRVRRAGSRAWRRSSAASPTRRSRRSIGAVSARRLRSIQGRFCYLRKVVGRGEDCAGAGAGHSCLRDFKRSSGVGLRERRGGPSRTRRSAGRADRRPAGCARRSRTRFPISRSAAVLDADPKRVS